jgi:diguanylate cyclase (GGDEF)-like protein
MEKLLRVLLIDDSRRDSMLLVRTLVKAGYEPVFARVDRVETVQQAVSGQSWDVVLCDSRMPTLSAETALDIWQVDGNDAPFIVVSGAIDDEEAVALLKAGAQDFVRKDNLARLVPAIERELREANQRRKRRQAEVALSKSEERYARLFKAAEISIWDQDLLEVIQGLEWLRLNGVTNLGQHLRETPQVAWDLMIKMKINDANDAALRMFGANSKDQLQQSIPRVFAGASLDGFIDELCAIWNGADVFRTEAQLSTLEGKQLSVILSMPVPKATEGFRSIPVSILDITDRRRAEQKLRESEARLNYLAYHDVLTNLPNRLLFQDRLQHAMYQARRADQQVAILFLDLDRFKTINDSLGHEVGDELLRVVSRQLQDCMRNSDTVARLGGDEFVVILEQLQDLKEVVVVARKILHQVSTPMTIKNQELSVSASIGISVYPGDSEDVEGLMRCADMAMYRAKEYGRDSYQFYTPDLNIRAIELLVLERDLRKALAQDQLLVHYQPQFDLTDQRLIGMEALVRWQHPERGIISPAEFIPLAEETGLVIPIGEWVMRTACAQNKAWQEAGHPSFKVAVNLSSRQFDQQSLVQTVDRVLSDSRLDPEYLELELTETIVMKHAEATIAALEALGKMGVALTIDDFGTGYSSLSYLKRFPINRLKIDRSFVRECTLNTKDAAIISSIIALAHGMNLQVIAEGVETEEQSKFLREQGSDGGQGYLYSHPLPPAELEKLVSAPSLTRH